MRFNLSAWALQNRQIVVYLMLLLALVGALSYSKLGQSEDPPFTFKAMVIQTQWPGATAEEVSRQVTERIEKKLMETGEYERIVSFSRPGESNVTFMARDSMRSKDIPDLWYQIRKKIGDIRHTLPPGVQGPFFNDEFGTTFGNIYALTGEGFDYAILKDYADRIQLQLQRVKNVGKVELIGLQDEKIWIELSNVKLATLGVPLEAVRQALEAQNAVSAAGFVETISDRVQLRVTGSFETVKEIRDFPIRVAGRTFRIGDVAEVHRGFNDPPAPRMRFMGEPAIGLAVSMKYTSCRHPSFDTDLSAVRLRLETDGTVTIYSSDVTHGQSHATMLAQIVADGLGVGFEKITLAQPDSVTSPFGLGTYASRGAAVLGTACRLATERLRERVLTIAAHVLEANVEDLEIGNDRVYIKGLPDTGLYLEILASFAAYRTHQLPPGFEPTLEAVATYDTPTERERADGSGNLSVTYSAAAHAAHVRVDPETGLVRVVDYAMAHDTGVVINPLVVEGQHQGGFLMGLGMVLGEDYVYDEDGHLTNASFKDYLAPTATDMPELTKIYEIPAPSVTIPGGQKGAGESGTGPVPAAVGNAVFDATGVRFTTLPITPQKMLLALREKDRQGLASFRFPDDMPDFLGPRTHAEWPQPDVSEDVEFDWDDLPGLDDDGEDLPL